jgi:hypothetical protein
VVADVSTYTSFVGGRHVSAAGGHTYEKLDPWQPSRVVGRSLSDAADVDMAIARAVSRGGYRCRRDRADDARCRSCDSRGAAAHSGRSGRGRDGSNYLRPHVGRRVGCRLRGDSRHELQRRRGRASGRRPRHSGCADANRGRTCGGANAVAQALPAGSGGPADAPSAARPFPDLRFIPTRGLTAENVAEWFAASAFAVGVGSDLSSNAARVADVQARATSYLKAAR